MFKKDSLVSPLFIVSVCFFLSGMAALLYQTAWMRQLSVVFGTSELAVATVLTAYMSGLSLGALFASKFIGRVTRPLLTYGVLEGGIAVTALAVPFFLKFADTLAIAFLGGQDAPPEAAGVGQVIFFYLTTLIVLIVPTALMGATLPLLSKYVVNSEDQIGSRIGGLYAINTVGAIFGTLVAGFVLLPNISLMETIWVGALLNIIVLYLVVKLVKSRSLASESVAPDDGHRVTDGTLGRFALILPIMTFSGIATFIYEVLWTRLLSHVLGGSVAAFSVMLAAFLTGIALGSAVAARYANSRALSVRYFIACQFFIALAVAATFYYLNTIDIKSTGLFGNSALAFFVLLPSTLFIGATFPFAVRIFALDEHDAPAASGRVYAYNTLGAIIGATLAGFFLIPALKYEGAVVVGVLINLSLALALYLRTQEKAFSFKSVGSVAGVLVVLCVAVFYRPGAPFNLITQSPLVSEKVDPTTVEYYDVGRSSTVLLAELQSYYRLRNNGLPEAAIQKKGLQPRLSNANLLAILPVAARPDAQTMLVAGFGGGVVVEAVPPSIKQVDVMELEPKVIEANRRIAAKRNINPLDDPRVNVIYNDARGSLKLTDKVYDIVVSQPSHPWTAGASHLYTKEYMELVKQHLSSDGVFLQWMNVDFTDQYLLRSLCKTLIDTFAEVKIYSYAPGVLYFLASEQPIEIERTLVETGRPLVDTPDFYARTELNSLEGLMSGLFMETAQIKEFSELAEPITDDFNLFGTRSALALENGTTITHQQLNSIFLENSPIFDPEYWAYDANSKVQFPYLIERLAKFGSGDVYDKIYRNLATRKNDQLYYFQLYRLFASSQIDAADSLVKTIPNFAENPNAVFLYLINKKNQPGFDGFDGFASTLLNSLPSSAKLIVDEYLQLRDVGLIGVVDQSAFDVLASAQLNHSWFAYSSALLAAIDAEKAIETNDRQLGQRALHEIDRVSGSAALSGLAQSVRELRLMALFAAQQDDRLADELGSYSLNMKQSVDIYDKPDYLLSQDIYKRYNASLTRVLSVLLEYQQNRAEIRSDANKEAEEAEHTGLINKSLTDSLKQLQETQAKLNAVKIIDEI